MIVFGRKVPCVAIVVTITTYSANTNAGAIDAGVCDLVVNHMAVTATSLPWSTVDIVATNSIATPAR